MEEENRRIISVDNLIRVEAYPTKNRRSTKKIVEQLKRNAQEEVINLVLELGPKGIAQYKKYHPLKFSIAYTNPYQTTALLKAFTNVHNVDELTEITSWLLFLGEDIKVKEIPEEVLNAVQERLNVYQLKQ